MMMVVAPDTVKHDRLPEAFGMLNGDPRKAYPASRYLPFKDNLTATGVIGDARRANADKGRKLLNVCAEGLAATLKNKEMWA
jgi:creatinine amidohydrolase